MSRLLAEVIVFAVLALGGWAAWLHHDHVEKEKGIAIQVAAEKAASAKQAAIDDIKLHNAEMAHEAELAAIAAQYAGLPRIVCHREAGPSRVPAAGVPGGPNPPAAVVLEDPKLYPDLSGPLSLLARRADRLAADARQLESATH